MNYRNILEALDGRAVTFLDEIEQMYALYLTVGMKPDLLEAVKCSYGLGRESFGVSRNPDVCHVDTSRRVRDAEQYMFQRQDRLMSQRLELLG